MKMAIAGLVAGIMMSLSVAPAQAVTASVELNPDVGALATAGTLYAGSGVWSNSNAGPKIVSGSDTNVYLSPYGGDTDYYALGDNDDTLPSFVNLVFDTTQYVFSFLWGSPDTWNTINFSLGGGSATTLAAILTAGGVADTTSWLTSAGAVLVSFSGFAFDTITFGSHTQALEMGNITAAVPLPAGVVLLGSGLAALGFVGWRRKQPTKLA